MVSWYWVLISAVVGVFVAIGCILFGVKLCFRLLGGSGRVFLSERPQEINETAGEDIEPYPGDFVTKTTKTTTKE